VRVIAVVNCKLKTFDYAFVNTLSSFRRLKSIVIKAWPGQLIGSKL